jgi:flagellar protein FliS
MIPHTDAYFETAVLTAPPQKLRYMLIDGSIRALSNTRRLWQSEQFIDGGAAIDGAKNIIAELISTINQGLVPEITRNVLSLYIYIYRQLVDVSVSHDIAKLDRVIELLDTERETWLQICEQLARQAPPPPHVSLRVGDRADELANSRFALDA